MIEIAGARSLRIRCGARVVPAAARASSEAAATRTQQSQGYEGERRQGTRGTGLREKWYGFQRRIVAGDIRYRVTPSGCVLKAEDVSGS